MRRLIAIVLLVFMPLQFSWAAVESYCALEAQVEVEHFGHHEHLQAPADVDGDSSAAAPDADCSHCHGHGAAMLGDFTGVQHPPSSAPRRAAPDEAGLAHASARPERPQWLRLA